MQMLNILLEGGLTPVRSTQHAAGYDLFSPICGVINPLSKVRVPLGVRSEFSPGWVGLFYDRSSWGVRGVMRLAGVLDSDYRGEWIVLLYNSSHEEIHFKSGDKIAQVIFVQHATIEPTIVTSLSAAARLGGFGSTGA